MLIRVQSQLCDSLPQPLKRFPSNSPCVSLRYVLSPRPACWVAAAFKQTYRSSSNVLVSVFFAQYSTTCISLRPAVSFFARRCGLALLLPALSRASSCGPVALLPCPSVPAVSFLFVGLAAFRSCPPYRVRRPVALPICPPYRQFFPSRRLASSRNILYTVH